MDKSRSLRLLQNQLSSSLVLSNRTQPEKQVIHLYCPQPVYWYHDETRHHGSWF